MDYWKLLPILIIVITSFFFILIKGVMGIIIIDGINPEIKTSKMWYKWNGINKINYISPATNTTNRMTTDPGLFTPGDTAWITMTSCSFTENGTIRTKHHCIGSDGNTYSLLYTYYENVQYIDINVSITSGTANWATQAWIYNAPEGVDTNNHWYGSGNSSGTSHRTDGDVTDWKEGWLANFFISSPSEATYMLWRNQTYGTGADFIGIWGSDSVNVWYPGESRASGMNAYLPSVDIVHIRTGIYNYSTTTLNEQVRKLWNSSFFPENITVADVTGTSSVYTGTTMRCDVSDGDCEIDVQVSNYVPQGNDWIFIEVGNWTSETTDLYWYNASATSFSSSDLWHHLKWNTSIAEWNYASDDPSCSEGTKLYECSVGNWTQICGVTGDCFVHANSSIYTVTAYQGNFTTDYTIYVGDSLPIISPPTIVEMDYCELLWIEENARLLSNDNWCVDNETLARNISFTIKVDQNQSIINSYSTEKCQFGCENTTNTCRSAPIQEYSWYFIVIIILLIATGFIIKLWKR